MVVRTPQRVLQALQTVIDTVADLTVTEMARCAAALVEADGIAGAVLVQLTSTGPVRLAHAGVALDDVDALVGAALQHGSAGVDGVAVVPVRCPQAADLVLLADVRADPRMAVVVQAIGQQLGQRLELIDTRRRLEEAQVRTDTLMSATQALGRSLELRDVLATILRQLRRVVPFSSASVQRLEGHQLHIIGGDGFPNLEEILSLSFDIRADDNPNRAVIETRSPRILEDASARYPAFREGPHMPAGIRAWLGVPLVFGDRILGMISIDSQAFALYDTAHAEIAQAFAAQAAIAIENARLFGEMRRMATHDVLTGLPNRRHLEEVGSAVLDRARHGGSPVSLLMCDLDSFKVINDTHGHAVGDEVLCRIARRFDERVRPQDVLSRYGGEEFVMLLPETDERTAVRIAKRLRDAVQASPVPTAAGALEVTISIGVVTRPAAEVTLDHLLRDADDAMYRAKDRGRNRVVTG